MTTDNLKRLADKLLRAELAARGAKDVEAAVAAVAPMLRLDASGDFYGVDANGGMRFHHTPGGIVDFSLADVIDETKLTRPELFDSRASHGGKSPQSGEQNPFAKGPGFNLTRGMAIWRNDPELGEALAAEAGFKVGTAR